MKRILDAADVISEIRSALSRLEQLQEAQNSIVATLEGHDKRIRELEASVRETKANVLLEAVKETQSIVNSVQSDLYGEIKELAVLLEQLRGTSEVVTVLGDGKHPELPSE